VVYPGKGHGPDAAKGVGDLEKDRREGISGSVRRETYKRGPSANQAGGPARRKSSIAQPPTMSDHSFDLIVIGGGPAGIAGANTAGIFGKRVALVEKLRELGGAGINTGTIPSKTLRETALALSGMRSRRLFGVDLSLRREATIADFMRHEANVALHERRRREEQMRTYNVETFHGAASFVDPHTIRVAPDTFLRGERILIATGSSPMRPAEFPFAHPRVHDSDEILEIGVLPKTLAVIGAGVIGAEYACTFTAIGVEVHLIDGRDSLLGFLTGRFLKTSSGR